MVVWEERQWGTRVKQRAEAERTHSTSSFLCKGSFELSWALCHLTGDTPVWDRRDKETRGWKSPLIPSVWALERLEKRNLASFPSCKSGPGQKPGEAGMLYHLASWRDGGLWASRTTRSYFEIGPRYHSLAISICLGHFILLFSLSVKMAGAGISA